MTSPTVSERRVKSFEYTAESIKQLITLATAMIAFTVTFAKDFVGSVEGGAKWVAAGGWAMLLISVCSGVFALQALAGQFDQTAAPNAADPGESGWPLPSIWSAPVKVCWILQQVTFGLGLLIMIIFGSISLATPQRTPPAAQPSATICVVQAPDSLRSNPSEPSTPTIPQPKVDTVKRLPAAHGGNPTRGGKATQRACQTCVPKRGDAPVPRGTRRRNPDADLIPARRKFQDTPLPRIAVMRATDTLYR